MKTNRIRFIVEADEPAIFFTSKVAAELSLESYDIEDGVYPIAFDRSGLIYAIVPHGGTGLLVPNPEGKKDRDRLRATIIRFLQARKITFLQNDSLDKLLDRCEPYSRR